MRNTLIDESELIQLCKKGDRRAHMHIYDKYSRAMYNVAYRFVKDSDEAQDMMQEGFIKAFSKLDMYNGETLFGAWLKRIVINNCLDAIRKRKGELSFEDERFLEPVIEVDYSNVSDGEIYDCVKKAINSLPESQALIVSLFMIEGYDYEEIEEITNVNQGTARSIVSRAKIRLKELLEKDEDFIDYRY